MCSTTFFISIVVAPVRRRFTWSQDAPILVSRLTTPTRTSRETAIGGRTDNSQPIARHFRCSQPRDLAPVTPVRPAQPPPFTLVVRPRQTGSPVATAFLWL